MRVDQLGASLVEGGKENDGTPVYIAKAEYHGGTHPGKAGTKLSGESRINYKSFGAKICSTGAYIVYGDKEEKVKVRCFHQF